VLVGIGHSLNCSNCGYLPLQTACQKHGYYRLKTGISNIDFGGGSKCNGIGVGIGHNRRYRKRTFSGIIE